MVTLLDAINRINYALRATDDDPPTFGDDEWNYWVDTLNRKKDELYEDLSKQWSDSYKPSSPNEPGVVSTAGTTTLTGNGTYFTDYKAGDEILVDGETSRIIDTITSDTSLTVTVAFSNTASGKNFTRSIIIDSSVEGYHVHRSLLSPSDKVYVQTPTEKIYLSLIKPQENDYVNQSVHLSGGNPQLLTFTQDILSDDQMVGGTLVIPGYYMPDDVSAQTDLIPAPDPNWLVLATAAEIAFTDIVYEDRAETLNSRANALWNQMVTKNQRGTYKNPRKVAYNNRRIRDTRTR